MFESEEKKRERAEAKARREAWRVDDAGNHEQEKIDIDSDKSISAFLLRVHSSKKTTS